MSAGLYSREVVARLLGKRVEEVERMIAEDGLPAVAIPSGKRIRHKFAASMLLVWFNKRALNQKWTVEMLIEELDRCDRADLIDRAEGVAA